MSTQHHLLDINILTPAFAAILSLAAAFLASYLYARRKQYTRKAYIKAAVICSVVTVILMIVLKLLFARYDLALEMYALCIPVGLAVALVQLTWQHKPLFIGLAALNTLLVLVVCLTLANDYYHYYPTLGSIFNVMPVGTQSQIKQITSVQKPLRVVSSTLENGLYGGGPDQIYSGTVKEINIPNASSGFKARPAYVYTPYIQSQNPNIDLPVLLLVPGFPSFRGARDWTDGLNLKGVMDMFAQNHRGITPIVVAIDTTGSPANDTECVNSPAGNAETYITQDVPNFIKSHYNISQGPQSWGIGGLSMGGMCSAMLALKHPDVFRYFLDFGGEVGPEVGSKKVTIQKLFDGSEAKWQESQINLLLESDKKFPPMGGYFLYAKSDSYSVNAAINLLYKDSSKRNFDVIREGIAGKHTFDVFEQGLKDSLPWISNRLGATKCNSSCTSF